MNTFETYWEHADSDPLTESMLAFARQHAWGWLRHWNNCCSTPLNEQDLEDLLSEAMIAVLRFKVPEDATNWEPCLTGYLKQVTYRLFMRARKRVLREVSLESLAPDYPLVSPENTCAALEGDEMVHAVACALQTMPRHHALAFLLHLEPDLQIEILEAGGQALQQFLQADSNLGLPCTRRRSDREIAAILRLTPRAVIRARQHACERLRKTLKTGFAL